MARRRVNLYTLDVSGEPGAYIFMVEELIFIGVLVRRAVGSFLQHSLGHYCLEVACVSLMQKSIETEASHIMAINRRLVLA